MRISISNDISCLWEDTALGILTYCVDVMPSSPAILKRFELEIANLEQQYTLESIAQNQHIVASRSAYKAFGKSPHEYRNSAEAMLRRIVKGNGLYRINNVVEINNIISICSGYSVGSYDLDRIQGGIELRCASEDAHYNGIGKGSINIGRLPVLFDELGPFGSPTSDSKRAMITAGDRKVVSIIYSFDGTSDLGNWLKHYETLLHEVCGIASIRSMDCIVMRPL